MRSPIIWFGGKGHLAPKLIPLIPPHTKYIEAFGGGGSLLFAKEPIGFECYNDLDENLVNFFRVLREPAQFHKLLLLVTLTPYSRAEYVRALKTWDSCTDPVARAYNWYLVARWSFGGRFGAGFGTVTNTIQKEMARTAATWLSTIDLLPEIHARFMRVQVECQDWRKILERYNGEGTFVYLDPPYIADTRKYGGYVHELTNTDHEELVQRVLEYPQKVMLSGYDHPIYEPLAKAGWNRIDFQVSCHAAGRVAGSKLKGTGAAKELVPRIESVWRNYSIGEEDV